ncbi:MAG: class I SAM-dependent methyltransferase [Verrucomicrobiota bacterium]
MQDAEYHNLATLEQTHWWHVGMATIAADWLRRLPHKPGGYILDAGCGTGGAMQWLAEFGRVCGLDRHPLAVQLAGQHNRHQLVQADVGAVPFAAGSFSILTAFDVLYHLAVGNDEVVLRECARVLRPGGWLLVRVPAWDWLRGAHDAAVHTRHRYSRQELRRKLTAAGFQPVRITYTNAALLVPAVAWRLWQRHQPAVSDVRQVARPVNWLLIWLLRLEQLWLQRCNLPVGLSVLALARKPVQ